MVISSYLLLKNKKRGDKKDVKRVNEKKLKEEER